MYAEKIAVLFIHGFMGHSNEFKNLKAIFNGWGYDTHAFTLSGHQKRILKDVTKEAWEKDCIENMDLLINNGYKKIIIVGHSMGGVLAVMMSIKYEPYVYKLILMDPAFEYLRMDNGKLKIAPSLKQIPKVLKDIKNSVHLSRVRGFSISAIRAFYSLINEHGNDTYNVKCPLLILHGEKDTIVPMERIKKIYDKLNIENKQFIMIDKGSHWMFHSAFDDEIHEKIKSFLKIKDIKTDEN